MVKPLYSIGVKHVICISFVIYCMYKDPQDSNSLNDLWSSWWLTFWNIFCDLFWGEKIFGVTYIKRSLFTCRSLSSWRQPFWMTSHTGTSYKPTMCPPSHFHVPPQTLSAGSSMERVQHGDCRVRYPSVTHTRHTSAVKIFTRYLQEHKTDNPLRVCSIRLTVKQLNIYLDYYVSQYMK